MGQFYEREGYGLGNGSWKENARFLKEFFGFDGANWKYKESKFQWRLKPNEIYLLEQSVRALSNNCTGPIRKMIKGLPRLGPFHHICLWLPVDHGDFRFVYERDQVLGCKDSVVEMLSSLFPEYQIGYYFRVAYQANSYAHYPEMHVHIALSRIRYLLDDRKYLEVFKYQTRDEQAYYSLFFHADLIMPSADDMKGIIEPRWRMALKEATGREVTSSASLVTVTGKEGQTILDRYSILRYIANQHLHTFQRVQSLSLSGGKVVMDFHPNVVGGTPPPSLALWPRDFVRKYIIRPMQTFGVQFRGRGFLHGGAAFAKVGDAAAKLVLAKLREGDERNAFLYDLPTEDIQRRSVKARRRLETSDLEGFERITKKYGLGDPLQELAILKEERKKKRLEAAQEFNLRKALKKTKRSGADDEDLLALG